jgi:hypothetical protein
MLSAKRDGLRVSARLISCKAMSCDTEIAEAFANLREPDEVARDIWRSAISASSVFCDISSKS